MKENMGRQPAPNDISELITVEQLIDTILHLVKGKFPGIDVVHFELLCNVGICAREWLRRFLTNCVETLSIPAVWRQAKVVAILKPTKPAGDPKTYRGIPFFAFRILMSSERFRVTISVSRRLALN